MSDEHNFTLLHPNKTSTLHEDQTELITFFLKNKIIHTKTITFYVVHHVVYVIHNRIDNSVSVISFYCKLTWRLIFPLLVAAASIGYWGSIAQGGRRCSVWASVHLGSRWSCISHSTLLSATAGFQLCQLILQVWTFHIRQCVYTVPLFKGIYKKRKWTCLLDLF
jgi:hypothetical protein